MPDIRLPNGDIARFPDNMPAAQIEAVLQRQFPRTTPAAPQNAFVGAGVSGSAPHGAGALQTAEGLAGEFNRMVPFADEVGAVMGAAVGLATGQDRNVGDAWTRARGMQNQQSRQVNAEHPLASALARGTGNAASIAIPVAPAAQTGSLVGNMARGAVTAGAFNGLNAFAGQGSLGQRGQAASAAAWDPLALAMGAGAGAMMPRTPRAPRPVDPNIRTLREAGVDLTPGQMNGGFGRATEDAFTSTPILGDAINAARTTQRAQFSQAPLARALGAIDERLPADIAPGTDSIAHAGDRFSHAYNTALPQGGMHVDQSVMHDISALAPDVATLTQDNQRRLANILEQRLANRIPEDGHLTGESYQAIQSQLATEVERFKGSQDGDQRAISNIIGGVRDALEAGAYRQDPAFAERLGNINRGYVTQVQAENAAGNAQAMARGGVSTPAQFASAVARGDTRIRHRGVARGEALNQDLAQAGQAILPNSINDSGTPRRVAQQALIAGLVGGGAGGGALVGGPVGALVGGVGTLAAPALASLAYRPSAIAAANRALDASIAAADRRAAAFALEQMAAHDPQLAQLVQMVNSRLPRAAGTIAAGTRAPATLPQ